MTRSPIAYFLFFISGAAALVYEIVWTRMLTLTFGHTVYSVSVVLAAFMAGLGLGSYVFGHIIDKVVDASDNAEQGSQRALLIYGSIEVLIFVVCAGVSLILSKFSTVYSMIHLGLPDWPILDAALKAALAFCLMVVPAGLMGATLPIIGKYYVTDDAKVGSQLGLLYFVNTLGAAAGCLLTGFFLISIFGVLQTALYATLINLFAGAGAIRIYQEATGESSKWFYWPRLSFPQRSSVSGWQIWMATSFVVGFAALAYETLWTRLLVFSISSTAYSFSMMLAVFLLGLALGGLAAAPLARRSADPRTALIVIQVLIGLYVIFSLYGMESLLSPPWNSYNLQNPLRSFGIYFKDSMALMLFPAILMGMNFPLLVGLASKGREQVGQGTGRIYAANTLGGIFGSLVAGFVLLPYLGSARGFAVVAGINFLLAASLFASGEYLRPGVRKGLGAALAVLAVAVVVALPADLLDSFFMRDSAGKRNPKQLLYFEEGLTDTVAVFQDNYGPLDPTAKRLITNGISMSASNKTATRYMKLFAHVPILLTDNPKDVLVICFGTGQTTGAAAMHPGVQRVDAVDLSAGVVRAGKVFAAENHDVLNNPKVNYILQDGRNHLLTTSRTYDVITGEPPPPRTAFTVNLYTRDYYAAAQKRLKPGGIFAQWVPLHSQSMKEVEMHFRTFLSAFPHAMAWLSVANEILIIGSDEPIEIDMDKLKRRMADPVVAKFMKDIQIENVYSLLGNVWFVEEQLRKHATGRKIITDNRPYIEFYLDLPNVIGSSEMEELVFSRVSMDELAPRISNMSAEDRKRLDDYYRAMDLYQRGVMYGNRRQLLEAARLVDDDSLLRYHLQAGEGQIQALLDQLEEDSENVEALLNLGHAYFQLGQYERSLDYLDRALAKNPRQDLGLLYRAYDLMELGRREEAKESFQAAVKLNPGHMSGVMQEFGLIGLLNELEKNPGSQNLINAAAQIYNVKNDYGKSLEYSLRAFENNPLDLRALQSIVFSYRGLGDAREVFDYGRRYGILNPDELHIQYILAEVYMKTLRYEKAKPYLEKILRADDGYRDAQKLLDRCKAKLSAEST